MSTLPIHEMFFAFQGEGVHMGRAAVFIRLFGCPLHCSFCDSAGTWHPSYVPKPVQRLEISEIKRRIDRSSDTIQFAVVTGGEPGAFDLEKLTEMLHRNHIPVHVETSGAFELRGKFNWVTVSPKKGKHPMLPSFFQTANEFKLIIETPGDVDYWVNFMRDGSEDWMWQKAKIIGQNPPAVWLHPEWSQRNNPEVLTAITKAVKKAPLYTNLRAGYQIHKLYKCDALDPASALPSPLGGDVSKGF